MNQLHELGPFRCPKSRPTGSLLPPGAGVCWSVLQPPRGRVTFQEWNAHLTTVGRQKHWQVALALAEEMQTRSPETTRGVVARETVIFASCPGPSGWFLWSCESKIASTFSFFSCLPKVGQHLGESRQGSSIPGRSFHASFHEQSFLRNDSLRLQISWDKFTFSALISACSSSSVPGWRATRAMMGEVL